MAQARFYTEESLGEKRKLTPEGFLVCYDVPIARIGTLLYGPGEVPIDAGGDGVISIERLPDDVFDPEAMASFEGKPVTNDHPPLGIKVTPENWRELSMGHVHNVRRGDGRVLDDGFLYADLMVKDPDLIRDIQEGKREVSAGYDAEYEQLEPGRGRQHDIIGNHVALVDKGRCGPRCAIGDNDTMAKKNWRDRLMTAFKARDEAALVDELDKVKDMLGEIVSDEAMEPGAPGGTHHVTVNVNGGEKSKDEPLGNVVSDKKKVRDESEESTEYASMLEQIATRLENVERVIMMLAQEESDEDDGEDKDESVVGDDESEMAKGDEPPWKRADAGETEKEKPDSEKAVTGDRRRRAAVGDSTSLQPAFMDMLSRAEILHPGLRFPTFDAAKGATATFDTMCSFRRYALAEAWKAGNSGRDAIGKVYMTDGKSDRVSFSKDAMSCESVTALFNGASEVRRNAVTRDTGDRLAVVMDHGREISRQTVGMPSLAEINEANRKRFGIVN